MNKYTELYSDIYSVFGTPEWESNDIKTIPANVSSVNDATEFIRVNIITDGNANFGRTKDAKGILLIDIFTPQGHSVVRSLAIGDTLDEFISGKKIGRVQFYSSSLYQNGRDRDNPSLHRTTYSIEFYYYGV
jgi:hypothetical protein